MKKKKMEIKEMMKMKIKKQKMTKKKKKKKMMMMMMMKYKYMDYSLWVGIILYIKLISFIKWLVYNLATLCLSGTVPCVCQNHVFLPG